MTQRCYAARGLRRLAAGAGGAALALLLAGCGQKSELASAGGPLAGGRYVAMGSSFAAGPGIGKLKPGTPPRCGRSFDNYATLLAEDMRMTLFDVTCGGASTAHILGRWNELTAQINAVTADTRLVTVTVGGNDIGYVGYLIGQSCQSRAPMRFRGREIPCTALKAPDEAAYQRLGISLRAIAAGVKRRAPEAQLVFVQYVTLVPETLCADTPLSPQAADTAREIGKRLAQITAQAAQDSAAMLVKADVLSAGHTPCDGAPWSAGHPEASGSITGAPWHPNRAGHAALARVLAEKLGS